MTLDEKDLLTIFTYASSQLIVMERVRKKARLKGIKDITKQKPLGRRVKIVEDGFLFWIVAIGEWASKYSISGGIESMTYCCVCVCDLKV